jgi:hypothetical protein
MKPRGFFKRRPSTAKLYGQVDAAVRKRTTDPTMKKMLTSALGRGNWYVIIHPANQPIEFSVPSEGLLVCSARTSTGGPGYHAYVVGLLDKIAEECGLEWIWDEGEEFSDETGFATDRDYRALQDSMLEWLQGLARAVAEVDREEEHNSIAVTWPLGRFHVASDHFAVTPLGPRSREWFEEIATSEISQLDGKGLEFFPWWQREMDAAFWRNCGLVQAWMDIPWHAPQNNEERKLYEVVFECFDRATQLDPAIQLPREDIEEMRAILKRPKRDVTPPREGLVGYRRNPVNMDLPGGWSITVPGYFHEDTEDDGRTSVFYFGNRTIHSSSFTMKLKEGEQESPAEMLASLFTEERELAIEELSQTRDHLHYAAVVLPPEKKGEKTFTLMGAACMPGSLGIVTICFPGESEKEWAVETWKSLHHRE